MPGWSSCGSVMDWLRSCYESDILPNDDPVGTTIHGLWRWCPEGARDLPFAHAFGSSRWDDDYTDTESIRIGEQNEGPWYGGAGDPRLTGQTYCGPIPHWQDGAPNDALGTPELDDFGYPPCCGPFNAELTTMRISADPPPPDIPFVAWMVIDVTTGLVWESTGPNTGRLRFVPPGDYLVNGHQTFFGAKDFAGGGSPAYNIGISTLDGSELYGVIFGAGVPSLGATTLTIRNTNSIGTMVNAIELNDSGLNLDHGQVMVGGVPIGGSGPATTDDLAEGVTHLYYTDGRADARVALGLASLPAIPDTEAIQDAIAAALTDSTSVDASYDDGGNAFSWDVIVTGSLAIGASGVELVGDNASPGSLKYYGTDGSGTKGFHDLAAGVPAGGSDKELQYNSSGSLAGISWVTFDNASGQFAIVVPNGMSFVADASGSGTLLIGAAGSTLLGFWGASPISRPGPGSGISPTTAGGSGNPLYDDTKFGSSLGSSQYTVAEAIEALIRMGKLAP